MSTVTLSNTTIKRARELLILYSQKSAFNLEEYCDVGSLYKRLTEAAEKKEDSEVSAVDVKYIANVTEVCAQRVPTEAQNFEAIADLRKALVKAIKEIEADEETKPAIKEI